MVAPNLDECLVLCGIGGCPGGRLSTSKGFFPKLDPGTDPILESQGGGRFLPPPELHMETFLLAFG